MKNLLNVVQVFDDVQQLLHAGGVFASQLDGVLGPHGHLSHFRLETGGLQRVFHSFEIGVRGQHLDGAIVAGDDVFGTGLQRHFHHLVFRRAGGKNQLATVLELKGHRPLGAQIATVLAERVPHLSHGAHAVVGHGVDDDGRAANAVALIANLFQRLAFEVARGFVHVVLDAVGRHIGGLGLFNGQPQAWVHGRIPATGAGGHRDLTNDTGPNLAALFVLTAFAVLNIRPFAVSSHG